MLYALRNKEIYWYRASLLDANMPVYVTSVLQADKFWTIDAAKKHLETINTSHRLNFTAKLVWTNIMVNDIKIWSRYIINTYRLKKNKVHNRRMALLKFRMKLFWHRVKLKINKI